MENWINFGIALLLVVINGFFVAAEFALVKARPSRLEQMALGGNLFAKVASWLARRLDASLSACQLGITLASLALGWVGEPAFHHLIEPVFAWMGISNPDVLHVVSLVFAFTTITALHLVIGEQAPKIFAIRKPEPMAVWCALPLAGFYYVAYPLLVALNWITSLLLRSIGVDAVDEHGTPHTEEELRNLVAQSHVHGELTRSEAQLINAVLEFDDQSAHQIMTPRTDVVTLSMDAPIEDWITTIRKYRFSRYPVVEQSLEKAVGVLHIQHLVGLDLSQPLDRAALLQPPNFVPETIPIKTLLQHFKSSQSLLAFVVDEHGTVVGVVTLEDVLEELVGELEDEFDEQVRDIVREDDQTFRVLGQTPLDDINKMMGLTLQSHDSDSLGGFVMQQLGRVAEQGDVIQIDGAKIEILRVEGPRIVSLRVRLAAPLASLDAAPSTDDKEDSAAQ
ncbi:hemolysin family protein [Rosistilla oblonga]|uniref:hemolysin family protein n=1 Tax=Rosistilla oblonga TaxID=2527990 RepID=UPI003A984873